MGRKPDRRQYLKGYRAAKKGQPIPVGADQQFRAGHLAFQKAHGGAAAPQKGRSMDATNASADGPRAAVEAAGLPTPETAPQAVRAELDPALGAVDPDADVDETEADRDEPPFGDGSPEPRSSPSPSTSSSEGAPGPSAASSNGTPRSESSYVEYSGGGVCWTHAHPEQHCQIPKPDGAPCGETVHEPMPRDEALQLASEIPTVVTMMLSLPRPVVLSPEQVAGLGYAFVYTSARFGYPGPGIAALTILAAVAKSIFDQVREIKAEGRSAGHAPPPADPTPAPPPQTPSAANGEQRTIVKRAA